MAIGSRRPSRRPFWFMTLTLAPLVAAEVLNSTNPTTATSSSGSRATPTNTTTAYTTNDLAAAYYDHAQTGAIVAPLAIQADDLVPSDVNARVAAFGLHFRELDGDLQRAVLWDRGYVLNAREVTQAAQFVRIWTKNGVSMANIQVQRETMEASGCGAQLCMLGEGSLWRSGQCSGDRLLTEMQCAVAVDPSGGDVNAALGLPKLVYDRAIWSKWATAPTSNNEMTSMPEVSIVRQAIADDSVGPPVVYTLRTTKISNEPNVGQCPSSSSDGDPFIVIPCAALDAEPSNSSARRLSSEWQRPAENAVVTTWLQQVAKQVVEEPGKTKPTKSSASPAHTEPTTSSGSIASSSKSGFQTWTIVPILVGVLVLGAVAAMFVVRRRQHMKQSPLVTTMGTTTTALTTTTGSGQLLASKSRHDEDFSYYDGAAWLSPSAHESTWKHAADVPIAEAVVLSEAETKTKTTTHKVTKPTPSRRRRRASTSEEILHALQVDPYLSSCHLSYEKIVEDRILSRTQVYEVWLGQYEGEEVAIKRLTTPETQLEVGSNGDDDDDQVASPLEAFVAEIHVTASVRHPNLATFMGIAWSRGPVDSLCLVMEYETQGDLRQYLRRHRATLTWKHEKLPWMRGIVRALRFLHHCDPPLLHHALHSAHVLLSDRLEPKLMAMGMRGHPEQRFEAQDLALDATAPFPYWIAPEVLAGQAHTVAADVFACGMLLAEMDLGHVPYEDVQWSPAEIMQGVISGELRPVTSNEMPGSLHELMMQCLHGDPTVRPSMRELGQRLKAMQDGQQALRQ